MKLFIASVAATAVSARMEVQKANPIRKVVTLLQDMQKEIEKEGRKEEELYKKYTCYCKQGGDDSSEEVKKAAATIERLKAQIKADAALKDQFNQELKEHKETRSAKRVDLANQKERRDKDHAQYLKDNKEVVDTLDQLKRAIKALGKGQGAAFLQTPLAASLKKVIQGLNDNVAVTDRETVMAFLSEDRTESYGPASGEIVGILKQLKDNYEESNAKVVSAEKESQADYESNKAELEKSIARLSEQIETKQVRVGELAVSVVQMGKQVSDTIRNMDDANAFAAELIVACKEKSGDWSERSKDRADELAAIGQAISVLNSDYSLETIKGAHDNMTGSFVQQSEKLGFLQTRESRLMKHARIEKKVRDLISSAAQMYKSNPALNLLAHTLVSKVRMGKVDFSQVNKMIDDMVALLKKEQVDDTNSLKHCRENIRSTEGEIKDQTNAADQARNAKERDEAAIADTENVIAEAKDTIKTCDKSAKESAEQRKTEHAEALAAEQLNMAAVDLLKKAQNKLQCFYNPALCRTEPRRELTEEERIFVAGGGEDPRDAEEAAANAAKKAQGIPVFFTQISATPSMLQKRFEAPEEPETYGEHKRNSKSSSVLKLIDMLTHELEKDQAIRDKGETEAQKLYSELTRDLAKQRAGSVKKQTEMESELVGHQASQEENESKQITAEDAGAHAKTTLADYHQSCDFIIENHDTRMSARENEIDNLSNAKAVLAGANFK